MTGWQKGVSNAELIWKVSIGSVHMSAVSTSGHGESSVLYIGNERNPNLNLNFNP